MKLFVHGFWSGFIENTNPVGVNFFIELLENVFSTKIELGTFDESDILLETIFDHKTFLFDKNWKYTFLFSGESRLRPLHQNYSCVLYGERNNKNIINVPLFIPYLYSSKLLLKLNEKKAHFLPSKKVCAIISNPCGNFRNTFLDRLEKKIKIDYAGNYKTNIPIINYTYNTPEFINCIKEYRCIISMENSRQDTYITEKITHGFIAGNVPVYWGSDKISSYFNNGRFINVKEDSIDASINTIIDICENDDKYLEMIEQNVFPNKDNKLERTINVIADDIKNLLFRPYKSIDKIFVISSIEFEPERYKRLVDMFLSIGVNSHNLSFICPTYKQTITSEIMGMYVKQNLVRKLRYLGMKKSEVSLFLNYKAVLEYICANYLDGHFLIFESDVYKTEDIDKFSKFIDYFVSKKEWDLIHIGKEGENQYYTNPFMEHSPYRDFTISSSTPFIEDITTPNDLHRLIRKFHTRCTDSFLWRYRGVEKFLKYMNTSLYEVPFDYYMSNFFEITPDFKQYWSMDTFFIQGTNNGLEKSTIQTDTE